MNRTIEIEFGDEARVEIPTLAASARQVECRGKARNFWLGWQLFRAE